MDDNIKIDELILNNTMFADFDWTHLALDVICL